VYDPRDEFAPLTSRPAPPARGFPPVAVVPAPWPGEPPPAPRRVRPVMLVLVLALGLLAGFAAYRWLFDRGTPAVDPRPITARGDMAADEKATIELFRNTSPSVVYITTLGPGLDVRTRRATDVPQGTGSGFIWDDAGHVVTNFHVIRQATGAWVTLSNHSTHRASLVGTAPQYDLALLRIDSRGLNLRPIPIGTSGDLQVGQKAFAIGNPFGLDQTLTTGVVSALGRAIPGIAGNEIESVIQTDAAINPGNSGGPLLDSAGRLIGVNTAIYSPSGSSAGIGFAVPVDTVNRAIPQLVRNGRIVRPQMGVILDEQLGPRVAQAMGTQGVPVIAVHGDTPAAEAGLQGVRQAPDGRIVGDVIQKIDGRDVRSIPQLHVILEDHRAGDAITLTVLRDGKPIEIRLTLQEGRWTQ
jgi:S1-C subfamily serine protease